MQAQYNLELQIVMTQEEFDKFRLASSKQKLRILEKVGVYDYGSTSSIKIKDNPATHRLTVYDVELDGEISRSPVEEVLLPREIALE